MDPSQAQFIPSSTERYFDPDRRDQSEQEFSASLEPSTPSVRFVVDSADEPGVETKVENRSATPPNSAAQPDAVSETLALAGESVPSAERDWRQEVSAKVRSYHSRRKPKARYPSLQLPFDPPRWTESRPAKAAAGSPASPMASFRQHESASERPAGGRLIEFPRPAALPAPPLRDELAEAVERPRIVEVPEIAPAPPAMGGILIEPEEQPEPEPRPGIDRPLQAASVRRRLAAGMADFLLVLAALGAFAQVFLRFNPSLPAWPVEAELALAFIAIFWPVYQYLFLVFSGTTPGLRLCGLAVAGFDGLPVGKRRRRHRALAALLSSAFLGIGYLWCLFDDDRLAWHDRVTRTHLGPRMRAG